MSNTDFLSRAIEQVRKAIEADNAAQYDKAYQMYYQSLELFMLALKWEKNPKSKEMIRQKTGEYMDRAEKLKAHLSDADAKRKKPGMLGANGSSTGGTGKGKGGEDGGDGEGGAVDEESKKLRNALAGAILQDRPNVKWEDVAGLEGAKEALKEAVLLPIKFPQMFQGNRKPWKGILLYGPPGTGKSYLAKALATEAKSTFFSVSSSDLVSKWMGESERYVVLIMICSSSMRHAIGANGQSRKTHTDSSSNSSTWPAKTNPPSSSSTKSTRCADPAAKANPRPRAG